MLLPSRRIIEHLRSYPGRSARRPLHRPTAGSFEALQRYVDRTNVLRTRFQTAAGRATVVDFMPVPEATRVDDDGSHRAIYRKLTCEGGRIDLDLEFQPRFEYARTDPAVERTHHGVVATGDGERAFLSSSVPLRVSDHGASASITLTEGETRWFVLGYGREVPDRPSAHQEVLDEVVDYWRNWAHSCSSSDIGRCPIGGP